MSPFLNVKPSNRGKYSFKKSTTQTLRFAKSMLEICATSLNGKIVFYNIEVLTHNTMSE